MRSIWLVFCLFAASCGPQHSGFRVYPVVHGIRTEPGEEMRLPLPLPLESVLDVFDRHRLLIRTRAACSLHPAPKRRPPFASPHDL